MRYVPKELKPLLSFHPSTWPELEAEILGLSLKNGLIFNQPKVSSVAWKTMMWKLKKSPIHLETKKD